MPAITWGLLWYDDQGTIGDRVRRASERHEKKYGTTPNICFANWQDLVGQEGFEPEIGSMVVDDCRVYSDSYTLKNHVWIGVYNEPE
jgi:hypothetical protein